MAKKYPRTNIPIHDVVVLWQPLCIDYRPYWVEPGSVAICAQGDPSERAFLLSEGAGSVFWEESSADELVRFLIKLKRHIAVEYRIPRWRIEGIFRRVREYRLYRVEQRRLREELKKEKRRKSVRTR
ncbi:hypothetical protein DFR49_1101 [Hephaestia caeni]|uniref:Uncharacterized protein n=1 Tax=Hephaestia caeni TaxID=645617 RepID=A0A397PFG6_9SPHN|nr:hypothetical protein [Hephaestia caeni]RIA46559.1 hypothetical protein DFR49_1101 [Hephaestia caeni]